MKVLAIDAATEACSAALRIGDALTERFEIIGRGHAARLLPMADELLREAGLTLRDLDGIAFGRGPGGFTGLRIAAGVAQGLAAGAGLPIVPVSNLAAVAAGAGRASGADRVLACMDARMGQVYWAAYENCGDIPREVTPERLSNPGEVALPAGATWYGAGHGFSAFPEVATRLGASLAGVDADALPRAAEIARIAAAELAAGRGLPPALGLPVYLRDDVVHRR
ncbi:MAG: tRNA (adenosine(37)-N6)-threonylcarbamoyltransferase complex dimerization subunit type 1 TsaB [Gammaproteobacteria bacterium]|nr:tRNA (adenosine(37)-N6)-threonylcarbamoyltransferase complex dimerization subunit type 1 TsaB [Gammaproteobacteria bacterium]